MGYSVFFNEMPFIINLLGCYMNAFEVLKKSTKLACFWQALLTPVYLGLF